MYGCQVVCVCRKGRLSLELDLTCFENKFERNRSRLDRKNCVKLEFYYYKMSSSWTIKLVP